MENNSSVCFISKIKTINEIENATNIELVTIEGWTSIVQKGVHSVGDLVLCLTTDAVIPQHLVNEWNIGTYLRKGNRVRTVKLKGVYSECILIDVEKALEDIYKSLFEGEDLMAYFEIYKYEPPVRQEILPGGRKIRYSSNPNFHVYYKFPNFKNVPNIFTSEDEVEVTRKIHGTNARYGIVKKNKLSLLDKIHKFFGNKWIEYEYVYGSHNVEKGSDSQGFYSTDVWKTVADKYNLKKILWDYVKDHYNTEELGSGFIVYGEIYGPSIQGDNYTYGKKELDIVFFDAELNNTYLSSIMFINTLNYSLGLPIVKSYGKMKFNLDVIKEIMSKNSKIPFTNVPEEGLVVKCITGDRHKIAKFINPEYLIYSEKNNIPDSH